MGSKTATADRNRQREANTAQLMQNIMTGGEISKKREAELQKAADSGRGIQFLPGSPTVKGLTQAGGKPVFRTGATAEDYTGRFTASPPTIGEFFGDAGRALFGGKASTPSFAQSTKVNAPSSIAGPNAINYAGFLPTPRESRGIIPALAEKVLVPGGITLGIAKDLFQKFFPGRQEDDTQPIVDLRKPTIEERVSSYVETTQPDPRDILKGLIQQSQAPGASELDVDAMSDEEVQLRLQSYGQGFAMGGLTDTIPPARGPMSEGVASLFKYK